MPVPLARSYADWISFYPHHTWALGPLLNTAMARLALRLRGRAHWLWLLYEEARLLEHALCNGLWRSLVPGSRKETYAQQALTWPTPIPVQTGAAEIVSYLRRQHVHVEEGGNAFYLPPQPALTKTLGPAVGRYPPGSGFKVLRDLRGFDKAHYLRPDRQTPLRRRLIGTPQDQLVAANYLHRLGLGPRVWDVCLLRSGLLSMPAFVVQHIEGTVPDADDW